MKTLSYKMKKDEKTPWEKRYNLATNTLLFGKPKKKAKWPYLLVIVFILLLGFLFN